MNKEQIRLKVKTHKSMLDDNERRRAASTVFDLLEKTAAFVLSDNILLYHSLPDELSTIDFIDKWHTRKHFFLPRVNGLNLEILPYDRSSLHLGAFRIEEPGGDDTTAVAFDLCGNRVGRGKGYYDRLLAETKAIKIGVGYGFQLVDNIDAEDHDVALDYIITENGVIRARQKH